MVSNPSVDDGRILGGLGLNLWIRNDMHPLKADCIPTCGSKV